MGIPTIEGTRFHNHVSFATELLAIRGVVCFTWLISLRWCSCFSLLHMFRSCPFREALVVQTISRLQQALFLYVPLIYYYFCILTSIFHISFFLLCPSVLCWLIKEKNSHIGWLAYCESLNPSCGIWVSSVGNFYYFSILRSLFIISLSSLDSHYF